jgi:hypothetical protein
MEELIVLAELFNVDAKRMIDMAYEQLLTVGRTKRRK